MILKDERDMPGVPPLGSGSRPTDGAASVSTADAASIPNAWPTFNLNREVAVKLTQVGIRILEDRHNEMLRLVPSLREFKPPTPDEHGWVRLQLWSLMQEFGPHIGMGLPVPFETTIALDASAIERAGTTEIGPVADESAVPKGDAQ